MQRSSLLGLLIGMFVGGWGASSFAQGENERFVPIKAETHEVLRVEGSRVIYRLRDGKEVGIPFFRIDDNENLRVHAELGKLFPHDAEFKPLNFDAKSFAKLSAKEMLARFETPSAASPGYIRRWRVKLPENEIVVGIDISADAGRVLLITEGGYALYDGRTGKEIFKSSEPFIDTITAGTISADGTKVALGFKSKGCYAMEAESAKLIYHHKAAKTPVYRLAISEDNAYLSVIEGACVFNSYPLASGKGVTVTPHKVAEWYPDLTKIDGSPKTFKDVQQVRAVGFAPSGLQFGLLWDFNPDFELHTLKPEAATSTAASFSLSEPAVVVASNDPVHAAASRSMLTIYRMLPKDESRPDSKNGTSFRRVGHYLHLPDIAPVEIAISPDNNWLSTLKRRWIEIHSTLGLSSTSLHRIDIGRTSFMKQARNRCTIAAVSDVKPSELQLHGLPELPWNSGVEFDLAMLSLLNSDEFAKLDEISKALECDTKSYSWSPFVPKHTYLNELLASPELHEFFERGREKIDRYLEKRPDSRLARMLLMHELLRVAWKARGDGFAPTVTPEGGRKFEEKIIEAHQVAEPFLKDENAPPEAISMIFEIAKAESWSPEKCEPFIERLLKICPAYFPAHRTMAQKLMVRWGGDTGDSEAYATRVSDFVGGPAGDILYGRIALSLSNFMPSAELLDREGFDRKRIECGITTWEAEPGYGDIGIYTRFYWADYVGDRINAAQLANRIMHEEIPFQPMVFMTPRAFQYAVRKTTRAPAP